MDQTQLQEEIAKYYSKLSPNTQKFFADMQWIEVLQELEITYSLNKEQMQLLSTETTLALLGVITLDEHKLEISNGLNIPEETLAKIFSDLYEKIFKQVSEDLSDTYYKNVSDIILEDAGDLPLPPTIEQTRSDNPPTPPTPKAPKTSQVGIFKDAGIEMVETPMNSIEEKMTGLTVSKKTVKDYTLPKMGGVKPTEDHTKNTDPYHEQI